MENKNKNQKTVKNEISVGIKKDAFDAMAYESIRSSSKIQDLEKSSEHGDAIVSDTFKMLYKDSVTIDEKASSVSKHLAEQILKLPEFNQLHSQTKLDEISSAFGTLDLAPLVIEEAGRLAEKQKKQQEQKQKNGDKPKNGGNQGQGEGQGDEFEPDAQESALFRSKVRAAMKESAEKNNQVEEAFSSFGINKGDLQNLSMDQKMEIAETFRNNSKFKKISDLAGRFKNVTASAKAVTMSHGVDEIVDIGMGSDISRMLPSEALKLLANPVLFYKDMIEQKLQIYNLKGTDDLGKGPIIVCLDISGSMTQAPQREVWAKSVMLALANLADKQKRSFGVVPFESKVIGEKFFTKQNPMKVQDKIDMATIQSTGGTNFARALTVAMNFARSEKQFKPSDIVFITDGEYDFSGNELKNILSDKEEIGIRIYGVGIGIGTYGKSVLAQFCDKVSEVTGDGEIDIVKDLALSVAAKDRKNK
jgi:uncharacterized protein with von Willebrand factor type A (vWA) domain